MWVWHNACVQVEIIQLFVPVPEKKKTLLFSVFLDELIKTCPTT